MESNEALLREARTALEVAGVELLRFHCVAKLRGYTQSFIEGKHGTPSEQDLEALHSLVEEYSFKMVVDGAYIAQALTELGFGVLDAHRSVAGLADHWAHEGRGIDSEAAALIESMAKKQYRIAYQRMQQGGHAVIHNMDRFNEAVAARHGLKAGHAAAPEQQSGGCEPDVSTTRIEG